MRSLDRDRQRAYIARYLRTEPARDTNGLLTGRNVPVFSEPAEFWPTHRPVAGEAVYDLFGQKLDYDLTLTVDDPLFEVAEADILWTFPLDAERGDVSWDGNFDTLDGGNFTDWKSGDTADGGTFANVSTREHDYVVRKVARKGDFTVIAAKRVEVTA